MNDATERRGDLATELPSKYLPQVEYRDLPEPQGLRKYAGASVIITATALGSGELILWPYLISEVRSPSGSSGPPHPWVVQSYEHARKEEGWMSRLRQPARAPVYRGCAA